MDDPCRPQEDRRPTGLSLLELMMVLTLILIAATITQPVYQDILIRAREAALRDTLFTMRSMIDRFTLDNQRPPDGRVTPLSDRWLDSGNRTFCHLSDKPT